MKERPILFSAPMVRALLAGTKTQTRRIVKPQPDVGAHGIAILFTEADSRLGRLGTTVRCPYGQPGDRLWVRETFCDDWADTEGVYFRADGELHADMFDAGCKWRPSIFMPRTVSRITLDMLGARVERLNDISEADAMAEGIADDEIDRVLHVAEAMNQREPRPAAWAYRTLWESINGDGSWEANPWVWVVEFKPFNVNSQTPPVR